jgi:hypothetical protein
LSEGNLNQKIVSPEEIAQVTRCRKESAQIQGATPI